MAVCRSRLERNGRPVLRDAPGLSASGKRAEDITVVVMEASGSYGKRPCYLLEDDIETWLLNARHMKGVPGRKTDIADSEGTCKMVEHGLVRPWFVPPRQIRQLWDLIRYGTEAIRERTREAQRLE